jgi:hypothetical protein
MDTKDKTILKLCDDKTALQREVERLEGALKIAETIMFEDHQKKTNMRHDVERLTAERDRFRSELFSQNEYFNGRDKKLTTERDKAIDERDDYKEALERATVQKK